MGQEAILTFFFEILNVQKQLKGNSLQHIYITIKYHQADVSHYLQGVLIPKEIVVKDFLKACLFPFIAFFGAGSTKVFGCCLKDFRVLLRELTNC